MKAKSSRARGWTVADMVTVAAWGLLAGIVAGGWILEEAGVTLADVVRGL